MQNRLTISTICGGVAPAVIFCCILLAIASYDPFSWTNNALSDLGVVPGFTMIIFNSGLIIGGVLLTVFALGLYTYMKNTLVGKIGSLLFVFATLSLICVGIFNEHFVPIHFIVSVSLFSFMALSFMVLSGAFWLTKQKHLTIFTLGLGIVMAIVWILEYTIRYVPHVAIPEFVTGFMGVCWVFVLVYKMLKKTPK
ncbi:MAG: DUF998 domain-containing protein [Bacteroidales bacterium]|nr:DUF998 domain-containing protein [Bacteroidales bacterium]